MASMDPALLRGPFTLADARRLGFDWHDLQTSAWRRLSHGQYAWRALPFDAELRLRAVDARMPCRYAFSGPTAAWILGVDMPPCDPVEVTVDRGVTVRSRAGIRVRRASLPPDDVVIRRGLPVTDGLRTACDLASGKDLVESVVALDVSLRAELVDMATLERHVAAHSGAYRIKRLRRAVSLANPASESPMETRLRLRLFKARLPTPVVQAELHDYAGFFIARVDLYYPDRQLVIEYDGENHKERFASDLRRQNALVGAGYQLLRFTASDFRIPGLIETQVRRARELRADTSRLSGHSRVQGARGIRLSRQPKREVTP